MNCPLSEMASLFGSLPTKADCPAVPATGSMGVMLLPEAPALEGTLAKRVCVFGSTTRSLVASETCRSSPGAGVGAGVGEGIGVGEAVGVGLGAGSDDGTSGVWTRKSWPAEVQKASPFEPQRMKLRTRPLTPATRAEPTGRKGLWSK